MRTISQEILYGVTGQSLVFDAPEGRPSSVTSVTVYEADADDSSTAESATTGSAAVETNPNTTFDAASGAGQSDPTKCNVAATTGFVRGRSYLAANATGDREWVPVVAIASADYVLSRVPLQNAYTASDALQGTRMSISLDSTWVANSDNLSSEESTFARYRVVWVYTVDSVVRRQQTYFDLVRYSAQHHVTGPDVDARFPGWIESLPTDYRREQGQALIEQAFRAVRMDLLADGKAARWLRNADVLDELVAYRARMMASESVMLIGGGTLDAVEVARSAYRQRYDQLVREPHIPLSVGSGGATMGAGQAAPIFRR